MKKTVIVPTGKNIAVVPLKDSSTKETEAAGIIVPDSSSHGPSRKGTVLAIGPDVKKEAFSVGDVVVHNNYGFTSLKVNGEEVLLMAEENIVSKFMEVEE